MSDAPQDNGYLQLPDLTVKGFRGIDDLTVSRLGRVTLVAGKNGSGKTTLLEAVQVYAARGRYTALNKLLRSREELLEETDEDGIIRVEVDWGALFHARRVSVGTSISIGPADPSRRVSIQVIAQQPGLFGFYANEHYFDSDIAWFRVEFQNTSTDFPAASPRRLRAMRPGLEADFSPLVDCNFLGPSLPDNVDVARFWDSVALTDDEDLAVAALSQITNVKVERVAVIGQGSGGPGPNQGRRVMVKIAGGNSPVPLKSLGDGATRFFALALALANSKNGFLVIDEAENGIHHSMQRPLWKMVLQTAQKNNVQVFAATHSWDCVRGFAQAMMELEDADGVLVRLERHGDKTRAIEYSEEELRVAAEQGIEVR